MGSTQSNWKITNLMKLGISNYLDQAKSNENIGLMTHANVLDESETPIYKRVLKHPHLSVKKVFGPQHGFWMKTSQAMMVPTASTANDTVLNLPLYSLYRNDSRDVDPRWLEDLDAILVDLPDVGVKVYTYIWSMAKMMLACAKTETRMIVCDRPNPISGLGVSGPLTQKDLISFVGLYPIAFCHGMTIGEIANYLNDTFDLGCELKVIPIEGWNRNSFLDETNLPWFNPSPNLRNIEALIHYPATVLTEATTVSEGRGTDLPFTSLGAPYIDSNLLLKSIETLNLPGIAFNAIQFAPDSDKYKGQFCNGILFTCTNRKTYQPVWTGIALTWILKKLFTEFRFRTPPYEYEYQKNPFDITTGNPSLRNLIENQAPLDELKDIVDQDTRKFIKIRQPFLIYN
jgi:uncharacterized protein YbbC (DUF1343 family)